jgi:hypothetical protein
VIPQLLLDPYPIWVVFVGIVLACLGVFEIAYRLGRRGSGAEAEGDDGVGGVLVGSMLALLAFLLAVTMGFAADRFDSRRQNVLDEANFIRTTFLRAGYLPEPYQTDVRALLEEYVPLRIVEEGAPPDVLAANIERSEEIQVELWRQAELVATELEQTDITALFVESVNDVITIHEVRLTAGIYARVPDTVILFLLILALISVGMVGYGAGTAGKHHLLAATLLILALGGTLTLVVDLDRPREGLLQVSQRPLMDLRTDLPTLP